MRTPFFYGWVIVALCVLAGLMSAASTQVFMGLLIKPIDEEMGWGRTNIAVALTMGSILAGVCSPVLGRVVDQRGPRMLMPLGAGVVALGFFLVAGAGTVWQFYLGYGLARGLGQCALAGVVPLTTVTNWFSRKRGRAVGLINMSQVLGPALLAPLTPGILARVGWRAIYWGSGIATAVLLIIPLALFLRRRPEELGLLPDGGPHPGSQTEAPPAGRGGRTGDADFTFREAIRTSTFWILLAAQFLVALVTSTVAVHQVPYYTDLGLDASTAAYALTAFALSGAFSNALWGLLAERFSERPLGILVMVLAAGNTLLLLGVRSEPLALLASALFGLFGRGEGALLGLLLARYFGRSSYGAISGAVAPFHLLGLGLGPLMGALGYDLTGSYGLVFSGIVAAYLVVAALLFYAQRPPPTRSGDD